MISAKIPHFIATHRGLVVGVMLSIGLFAAFGLQIAEAHEVHTVGPYKLAIGWREEPVLIGSKNGLEMTVVVSDTQEPVTGLVDSLKFEVSTGPKTASYDLEESDEEPGRYFANFIPTRLGQYTFHITGTINDTDVDLQVTPEEVGEASRLEFPEPQLTANDLRQMQQQSAQQLTAATNEIASARTLALAGVGTGILGMVLGGAALMLRRR